MKLNVLPIGFLLLFIVFAKGFCVKLDLIEAAPVLIQYTSKELRSIWSTMDPKTHGYSYQLPKEIKRRRRGKAGGV